jgi:hypothetical protein
MSLQMIWKSQNGYTHHLGGEQLRRRPLPSRGKINSRMPDGAYACKINAPPSVTPNSTDKETTQLIPYTYSLCHSRQLRNFGSAHFGAIVATSKQELRLQVLSQQRLLWTDYHLVKPHMSQISPTSPRL